LCLHLHTLYCKQQQLAIIRVPMHPTAEPTAGLKPSVPVAETATPIPVTIACSGCLPPPPLAVRTEEALHCNVRLCEARPGLCLPPQRPLKPPPTGKNAPRKPAEPATILRR